MIFRGLASDLSTDELYREVFTKVLPGVKNNGIPQFPAALGQAFSCEGVHIGSWIYFNPDFNLMLRRSESLFTCIWKEASAENPHNYCGSFCCAYLHNEWSPCNRFCSSSNEDSHGCGGCFRYISPRVAASSEADRRYSHINGPDGRSKTVDSERKATVRLTLICRKYSSRILLSESEDRSLPAAHLSNVCALCFSSSFYILPLREKFVSLS